MFFLSNLFLDLWLWTRRGWSKSEAKPYLTEQYTPEERHSLHAALSQHTGFKLLMDELEHYKAGFEAQRESLCSGKIVKTDPEALKSSLIQINEAIYWIGWMQYKVNRGENEFRR